MTRLLAPLAALFLVPALAGCDSQESLLGEFEARLEVSDRTRFVDGEAVYTVVETERGPEFVLGLFVGDVLESDYDRYDHSWRPRQHRRRSRTGRPSGRSFPPRPATDLMPGTFVNKATPNERTLNFWERLYLPEIFKGLGYSASKMKLESYAFEYPEEQWYPPDAYRGRPVLVEEEGRPRCVACGLCARSCPPLAISMQAHEVTDDIKEREPAWFEINMLRCIYCGFCEEVCPEEAIVMSKEYDMTFQDREEAHFGMDKLLMPKERLVDRLDFLERRRNGQFGEAWAYKPENNVHTLRNRLDYIARVEDAVADENLSDPQEPIDENAEPRQPPIYEPAPGPPGFA